MHSLHIRRRRDRGVWVSNFRIVWGFAHSKMCKTFASAFFFHSNFRYFCDINQFGMGSMSAMLVFILAAFSPFSAEGLTLKKIQNIVLPVANDGFKNFTSVNMPSPVGCWLQCLEGEDCQASSYDDSTKRLYQLLPVPKSFL